jgi:hypothetical protein
MSFVCQIFLAWRGKLHRPAEAGVTDRADGIVQRLARAGGEADHPEAVNDHSH